MRCGDSFLATITTYIKAHADDYSSGTYTIVRKLNIPDYTARYMIQLYGDGALHLNAFIAPPAVDGGIVPIFFSIDISQIDGSYDWEYSYYGDMEGTIYSATLKNNTDSLLYLTTDMGYYSEINSAQELSATLAKGLIEFLADVAMAADECLTLDNFGFVNYIYNPTEHVPGENGGGSEAPQITRVTSVSLNKSTLSLKAGEEASLTATVSPSNATNKTILWSSSNNDVATVTNGRVVAVGSGTAVITATSQDGNKTAKCTVTVQSSYEILRDAIEESGGKVSVGVLLGASITLENKSNSIHISLEATQTVLYTSSTTVIFSGNIYEDGTADGYSIYSTIKYSGSVYTGLKTTESKSTTLYFDFSLVDLGKEFDYYVTFDSSSYTQDRLSYNITYSGTHMTTAKSYARDILDDVIDGLTNLRKLATNPSYTITYDANNGQVSSKTQTVKYEGYCVLLTPTRNGYDFDGWYYNGTKVTSGKWTINHDVTLTAKWTPKNYTITYSLNGGRNNSSNPSSYSTGASITLLEPTKTGYTFIGWTTSNVTTPTKNISIKPTDYGDKTFTANWSANTYNVTFDANGGQCSVQTAKYTYGNSVTLPVPYKEDYDFVGWYNGATKVENGTWRVPNNCTLTAKWTLKQYSISYVLDGGKNNLLNPNTYTKEMEVTLLDPTRTGYSFIGWTTDGITSPTKSIKIEKGSSGAKTFTAHWTANTYTAIFDADGGTCDIETKEFVFDEMCSLPTPTRIGYIFTGWYYNNSQIGSVWKIADDCTLIAMWSAKTDTTYIVNHYKENANDNSYTLYETQNLTGASDSFVTPEVNTYEGFTSPERQTVTIAPDGSLIVDYFYIRNCYTLSFVMNGGQEISDIQVKYQESVNMPVGIREDFTFGGWFIDKNLQTSFDVQTMHSDDQTLYAWWCEENKPADFKYSGTTAITVSGYTGNDSTLWIPSYIGDVAVTSISASAFANHLEVTKVVVPDSVTSIGSGAFKGCVAIEDITLPFVGGSLTSTTYYATFGYIFGYSTSSASGTVNQCSNYYYYIPSSIKNVTVTVQTNIPAYAFKNCDFIETIHLPKYVETYGSVGSYAFQNCSATILYDVIPKISMPWKGSVATAYNSGSGTKEDPFVIFTPEQFAYFASQVNGGNSYSGVYFKLASDINLNRYALNVIGGSPETPFAGVFDGNGFTISRINISSSGNYVGLFGYCSGTIKNLGLASGTITANSTSDSSAYVGALVGWLSGTIDNCYSNASVNATLVKDSYVGGLIGANDGLVTNSHCGGNVVANYSYAGYAGGFVGLNKKSIKDSYATGNVTCNSANFMAYAGGFVGTSTATIQDCYAAGNVTAKGSAFSYSKNGGFVGDDVDESLIVNCFRASEQVLTQYTTRGSAFNTLGTELPLSEIVKIIG